MKNLLKTVTDCVDRLCEREGLVRHGPIIGGEAVILHGIPRTTIDIDILLAFLDREGGVTDRTEDLAGMLRETLGETCGPRLLRAIRECGPVFAGE